ncbi:hypothetical protein L2X99_01880 [Microbacterium sp. KUDC0406]|nr:hypothetical protein [Microbacterium sp. KUDC0406]UJP10470.1 hypothetical protein L2X99_01880 [Microbacterium sp. KUDC0406]
MDAAAPGRRSPSPDPPARDADRQSHRVDAAHGAQFGVARGDPFCGEARGAQADLVAEQVREQCGAAGDELGQAARVRLRYVDAVVATIAEPGERGPTAEIRRLGAQTGALCFGGMRDVHPGAVLAELAQGHRGIRLCVSRRFPFTSPHTSQTRRADVLTLVSPAGFPVFPGVSTFTAQVGCGDECSTDAEHPAVQPRAPSAHSDRMDP